MKQMNVGAMELIDKNQAIEIVRDKCKRIPTCAILAMDAIDKLPVSQKELDWIDVDTGLPDMMGYYLTSSEYYDVRNDFFDGDDFETAKMYHYKVIAWRELPKPYKKVKEMGMMREKMMTNGEKFRSLFGISASELWCMNGEALIDWLNEDFVEGKNPCSECQEFNCYGCEYEYRYR